MITWSKVHDILKAHCIHLTNPTLREVLDYLYIQQNMSIRKITELADLKCSNVSLKEKMKELGIKTRSKGGANYTKPFTISKEEYKGLSYKGLALKYKVSITTIHNRCKKYIEGGGKKRKPTDKSS